MTPRLRIVSVPYAIYANDSDNRPKHQDRYKTATRKQLEKRNEMIKIELSILYGGECQICNKTFKMKNGENYFDSTYIVDRVKDSRYEVTANALCLCPEHFAKWMLEEFTYNGETVMFAPAQGFYATPNLGKNEIRLAYILNSSNLE
jgi:hypothetical protein